MDKVREVPAHIFAGIAVLLFGLGLVLIMQAAGDSLPEWPGKDRRCAIDSTATYCK